MKLMNIFLRRGIYEKYYGLIKKIRGKWHEDLLQKVELLKSDSLFFKQSFIRNYDVSWMVHGKTWFADYQCYDEYKADYDIQEFINKVQVLACHLSCNIKLYCNCCNAIFIGNPSPYGINESYQCPACGMNSRMRAMYEFIDRNFSDSKKVYIQEAVTSSFKAYEKYFGCANIMASEFLGNDKICGEKYDHNGHEIMHQDCTKLSFDDNTFDLIISQDVLEHIPDTKQALFELFRVIKPNGAAVIMIPFFRGSSKSRMLAKIKESGQYEYLAYPPEIHGNPLGEGSLAFWHHGWEFLEIMRTCGFSDVKIHCYHNVYKGHFGVHSIITGKKSLPGEHSL